MTHVDTKTVTHLLEAAHQGDCSAVERLRSVVYDELVELARQERADRPEAQEAQTAILVRQAYDRLLGNQELRWINRYHFYKAAALAMRRSLVEAAQQQDRAVRGKDSTHLSQLTCRLVDQLGFDAMALDEALERLHKSDSLVCDVVHLRFLAGLSVEDTGRALELSPKDVEAKWTFARAWLHRELKGDHDSVVFERRRKTTSQ